jgi:hypothetical protein
LNPGHELGGLAPNRSGLSQAGQQPHIVNNKIGLLKLKVLLIKIS